MLHKTNFN